MNSKLSTLISMVLIGTLFFVLVFVNNALLSSYRLDLTENKVYSLSDGSKAILSEIEEPINLYFFFSDKASKGMTSLRNYANRIESLLEEYQKVAGGNIKLNIIDPEAFSEAEDQANQFGLTAATIGANGEAIYMGLAGSNALDDQQIIAFFDPQKEQFLEYDVSKLVYQLSSPNTVNVTVLSDLPLTGGQNPMSGQMEAPYTFYTQLEQLYQVELIGSDAANIPEDTDVLMLIHPKALPESLLFSIDQYAMTGGKLMAFVDPHFESDPMAMMAMENNSSNLEVLFNQWGVSFDSKQVLLDAAAGLDIRTQNGGVTRHFGFVGLSQQQLDREDVTTAGLEMINGASFGTFTLRDQPGLTSSVLLSSSTDSDLIDSNTYATTRDPEQLANQYSSSGKSQVLGLRLTGKARSAFEKVPDSFAESDGTSTELVTSTDKLNVILVGDADLLADRFWVQQANFFGQTVFTPFADNGDFVNNGVENLGGSNALISIRSRGTFARPFTVVNALEVKAEEHFREQEQLLQAQLDETENQLTQLQSQQGEAGALVITAEQQEAIDDFMQKKIAIRKALREVRHQLDKDIESLGNWLKFINIAVAPLVLILVLMVLRRLLRIRSGYLKGVAK